MQGLHALAFTSHTDRPFGFGVCRRGRFAFGRLVDMFGQRLSILPPQHGARQVVLTDVPWIAVVRTLIRAL